MATHNIEVMASYFFPSAKYLWYAQCSCGWNGEIRDDELKASTDGTMHVNSVYGKHTNERYGKLAQEKHASPAAADWHLTLKSPKGNTYTLIVDGLAEAVDYAHTMRFEFGWELLDFHREQ